jgi:hypothetical protein
VRRLFRLRCSFEAVSHCQELPGALSPRFSPGSASPSDRDVLPCFVLQENDNGQAHPQDAPMTQPLGPPPSSTGTNPTPHQSQTGGLGDAAETPAATQDASGTAGLAGEGWSLLGVTGGWVTLWGLP